MLRLRLRALPELIPEAGAAALYTATLDAPSIHLAETRGPDRAPGYFPVKISSGTEHTWLRWTGSAIEVAGQ